MASIITDAGREYLSRGMTAQIIAQHVRHYGYLPEQITNIEYDPASRISTIYIDGKPTLHITDEALTYAEVKPQEQGVASDDALVPPITLDLTKTKP